MLCTMDWGPKEPHALAAWHSHEPITGGIGWHSMDPGGRLVSKTPVSCQIGKYM